MAPASTRSPWPFLVALVLATLAHSIRAQNVTRGTIISGGKLVLCGLYSVRVNYWADGDYGFLYVTDTACNPNTGTPCKPPSNPALALLSCAGVLTCKRETTQTSDVPLCLVVSNVDQVVTLTVELAVTGSSLPGTAGGSSSSSSRALSDFKIALICAGGGAGLLLLSGLVGLAVWYCCCRRPPIGQVAPAPPDGMVAFAAKSLAATPAMAPGMGPHFMNGTITLVPAPPMAAGYASYGGMAMQAMPPPGTMQPPGMVAQSYGGARAQAVLEPLPQSYYAGGGAPTPMGARTPPLPHPVVQPPPPPLQPPPQPGPAPPPTP